MHPSCRQFVEKLTVEDVAGKRVLEVGSYDVNGSVRAGIEALGCLEYIGVDIQEGKGVDKICDAADLVKEFGPGSFDIIISTEMLEHVEHWQAAVSNMKQVCCAGGLILITARSKGCPRHGYPDDYWRFELDDMNWIFADCEIVRIEDDKGDEARKENGVFILVRKPEDFTEVNLLAHELCQTKGLSKGCNDMETQETTTVLRQYAQGEVKGKKALLAVIEAARTLPPSHNRTLVLQDIARKLAGQETGSVLQAQVNMALVGLVGLPEPEPEPERPDFNDISYSQLQSMCKDAGFPANGEKEDLIARLTKPVEPTEQPE